MASATILKESLKGTGRPGIGCDGGAGFGRPLLTAAAARSFDNNPNGWGSMHLDYKAPALTTLVQTV